MVYELVVVLALGGAVSQQNGLRRGGLTERKRDQRKERKDCG